MSKTLLAVNKLADDYVVNTFDNSPQVVKDLFLASPRSAQLAYVQNVKTTFLANLAARLAESLEAELRKVTVVETTAVVQTKVTRVDPAELVNAG